MSEATNAGEAGAHDQAVSDQDADPPTPLPNLADVGVVDDQYKDLDPEVAAFYREKDKFLSDPEAYEKATEAKDDAFEQEYGDNPPAENQEEPQAPAPDPASPGEPVPPPPPAADDAKGFRFKADNDIEARAYELKAQNPILSMREALDRAESEAGGTPAEPEEVLPPLDFTTTDEIDAAIKEAKAEKRKAATEDFDRDAEFAAEDRIDELLEERKELTRREGVQAEKAVAQEEQQYQGYLGSYRQSEQDVAREYPVASNPDSEFYKRTEVLDAWAKDNHPELYQAADKPMRLATMVAKEQSVQKRSEVPPPPTPTSTGSEPGRATPPIASGTARTSGSSPIQDDIDRFSKDPTASAEDFQRLKEKVLSGG